MAELDSLSAMFNAPSGNTSTYSWNDFFNSDNQSQIGDNWIPEMWQSSGGKEQIDPGQYSFTSLPYQKDDWFVADVQGPNNLDSVVGANGWGFRGQDPRYFKDDSGKVFYTPQYKDAQSGNFDNVKWQIPVGSREQSKLSQFAGQALPMVVGGMLTGGVGGAAGVGGTLGSAFGGGTLGNALGYGLTSGGISSMQGGDFGSGFLAGAVGGGLHGMSQGTPAVTGNNPSAFVPATSGTSIAGLAGVSNPTLAGVINRGAGSALGSLAAGKSGSEILQSGLTGAALSGINSAGRGAMDFYKNSINDWLGGGNTEADYSTGSTSYGSNYMAPGQSALREAGLFPDQSNVPPSSSNFSDLNTIGLPSLDSNPLMNASYGAGGYRPMGADILEQAGVRPGMSYAPPGSAGDMSSDFLSSFSGGSPVPDQRASSVQQSDFSLPSVFGDVGRSVGNFALNNAGDLASMLYGFYNNRKQQKALGQQVSSLQGLYGQNSPYAQQLRNTLNAKAAQSGRRSNVAGRETQFQAQLADRAASMAPTLMQLNQARGQLKNSLGSNALSMFGKMGGFNAINKGLGNLFGPSTTTIPYNNGNVSGSDMFGWKGSGGM